MPADSVVCPDEPLLEISDRAIGQGHDRLGPFAKVDARWLRARHMVVTCPRVHRHRYHGVLAPNARLRPKITAWAQQAGAPEPAPAEPTPSPPDFDTPAPPSRAATPPTAPSSQPPATPPNLSAPGSTWARLLARIYEVFPLLCSTCGSELRIIAFLTDPAPVRAILDHFGLPSRPPPVAPARAPPELAFAFDLASSEFDFDQTPAFEPSDPEPIPEFELDQRRGA